MPYAVIGILNTALDAKLDDKPALQCLKDNIHSKDEAEVYLEEQNTKEETKKQYGELFVERHDEGKPWRPRGGRCFFQALSIFMAKYPQLVESGYMGDHPRLVHGYGEMFNPEGVLELSAHAWIEGDKGYVFDCGSYIPKLTLRERAAYYAAKKIRKTYSYSFAEAEQHWKETRVPFPWDLPPNEYVNEKAVWDGMQEAQR
jgi:hypothetical protein